MEVQNVGTPSVTALLRNVIAKRREVTRTWWNVWIERNWWWLFKDKRNF